MLSRSPKTLFPALIKGERIIYHGRVHWFLWGQYIFWLCLIALGIYAHYAGLVDKSSAIWEILIVVFFIFLVLGSEIFLGFMFYAVTIFLFGKGIAITDIRVVVYNEEVRYSMVKDIKVKKGWFGKILGYRHVFLTPHNYNEIKLYFLPEKVFADMSKLLKNEIPE